MQERHSSVPGRALEQPSICFSLACRGMAAGQGGGAEPAVALPTGATCICCLSLKHLIVWECFLQRLGGGTRRGMGTCNASSQKRLPDCVAALNALDTWSASH